MALHRRVVLFVPGALVFGAASAQAPDGPRLGLDAADAAGAEAALPVLRLRLAALGLGAATVSAEGARIVVGLPPGADARRIAALLPRPGRVAIHRVAATEPGAPPLDLPAPGQPGERLLLAPTPAMQGDLIAGAALHREPWGSWAVHVTLREAEARRFHELTRAALGQTVAMLADGAPLIAAVVREPIAGGRLVISGNLPRVQAEDIAALLAGGPLPGPLRPVP